MISVTAPAGRADHLGVIGAAEERRTPEIAMGLLARMGLTAHSHARPQEGDAAGRPVTIINHGTGAIAAIHARPFGTRNWGRDLLGGRTLQPGATGHIRAAGDPGTRRWDVSIEYACGAGHFLRGVALSEDRHLGVSEFGVRSF